MAALDLPFDPFASDPGSFGVSLSQHAELLIPILDAAEVRSVVEVGAYAGDLTGLLLAWAQRAGTRVMAIDPSPQDELERLDERSPELELVRQTSLEALARIPLPDAVVIDGDHNHFTVSEELRIVADRAGDAPLPLLLFHDVAWPHARRDDYFDPETVPAERRRPLAPGGGVVPGQAGTSPQEGLRYPYPAAQEGGPGNGVLTAVEDFVAARPGLRLAVVPAFFGFGVVWSEDAPYAAAVTELLERWDGNPLLERLEANRVLHLVRAQAERRRVAATQERDLRRVELLDKLLQSRSFAVAERISRVVQRGRPAVSRTEILQALGRR